MDNRNNDPRLSADALEAAVDFAYGGAAVRAGRKAQARALACMLKGKLKFAQPAGVATARKV